MSAETDLLQMPDVKCWRAMKDRNGNVGYSDKPDPKYSESAGTDGLTWVRLNDHRAAMQAYARANMEPLIAEIEALRAEVAEWKRVAAAQAELHGEAEARAERLAEALRLYMAAGFGNSTDFYKQAEAQRAAHAAIHPTATQEGSHE